MHALAAGYVHQCLQPFCAAAAGDHVPAAGDEAFHRRATEARGGPGDQRRAWRGDAHFALIASAVRPPPASLRLASASRSEEHTSELQSLMRISYAVFCLKNKK